MIRDPKIMEKVTKAKIGINNSMISFIRIIYPVKNLMAIIYDR
jgi:hypothetical protein